MGKLHQLGVAKRPRARLDGMSGAKNGVEALLVESLFFHLRQPGFQVTENFGAFLEERLPKLFVVETTLAAHRALVLIRPRRTY